MNVQSMNALETEIIRFFENPNEMHDLPEIVEKFRTLADDASIKAALLRLSLEGLLEITPDWEFRGHTTQELR
jgi:hypothetical protein